MFHAETCATSEDVLFGSFCGSNEVFDLQVQLGCWILASFSNNWNSVETVYPASKTYKKLWKITMFNGKIHYFYHHVQ